MWLPGMLPLLHWPKKLLLGIGIGIAYKVSHKRIRKKEIGDVK
jgi:hypothetical protein